MKNMKKIAVVMALSLVGCASMGKGEGADGQGISAPAAIGGFAADAGPLYEGDGGKDIRLAVLAPEVQGNVPDYLPVYVQGFLNTTFKKYSAITLIDRQNLDRIIKEQNLAAGGRFSDEDFIKIGSLTNAQYFLFGMIQELPAGEYSLQLSLSGSSSGDIKAAFMKTAPLGNIANGALINQASADLLSQLEVRLTDTGRESLLAGNPAAVLAETGLAKGITAQARDESVEALFNFTQAAAFDPAQMEALARLSQLSSSISGGSLSERIINDLQARDRWVGVFKETARFFNDHPPFDIVFDPALLQEGETDYKKRIANLAMRVALEPSEAGFAALNALIEGLEKTGRRSRWGFNGWPLLNLNPNVPDTKVFGGKRSMQFKVDIELRNDRGTPLGKARITLKSGVMTFSSGDTKVAAPKGDFGVVRFPKVKADDLTPVLTIAITAVNGIPAQQLNAAGYMRIGPGSLENRQPPVAPSSGTIPAAFVRIPGGTFLMGSPASEPERYGDETQHTVMVSSFYIGRYEVTQKEWQELMGSNPSYFKGDNLPVENVSWYDVIEYCNKRSQREGLEPAYTINGDNVTWNRNANGYRLPTEAEWEYACRAGTTTPFNTGSNITTDQANYDGNYPYNGNPRGTYRGKTWAVGSGTANAWGLYDMHGNVWEWCWDWYDTYPTGAQTDPTGPTSGSYRVSRGGSWGSFGRSLRAAYRGRFAPSLRSLDVGFRLSRPSS